MKANSFLKEWVVMKMNHACDGVDGTIFRTMFNVLLAGPIDSEQARGVAQAGCMKHRTSFPLSLMIVNPPPLLIHLE